MTYRITSAVIDGVRGVNKELKVTLNPGLTVFYGPNGSGKSSILQALEWCMTGSIPYMSGGDFTREDAIVNAFTRTNRARVELTFTGPDEFTLSRRKNRTNSTTSGKHQITLNKEKSYESEEALKLLQSTLALDLDELPRSKFLHQETIRDALTYKPSERSAIIEKLLGTYEIKEFSKALDLKTRINSETKTLEARINGLQKDHIQLILNLKRSLTEQKDSLLGRGFKEGQLSIGGAFTEIEAMRTKIDAVSTSLDLGKLIHPTIYPEVASLLEANTRLQEDLTSVDRERMGALGKNQQTMVTLGGLIERYRSALEHFKTYETMDTEALEKRKKELETTISEIRGIISKTQNRLNLFPPRLSAYENAKRNLEAENEKLEKLLKEYGDEAELTRKIGGAQKELDKCVEDLSKYAGQQRIVNMAAELIEKTKPMNCPVCEQSIEPESLAQQLRSKVSQEISSQISRLNGLRDEKTTYIERLVAVKGQLSTIASSFKTLESRLASEKERLESIIEEKIEKVKLDELTVTWEDFISSTQGKLDEINEEYSGIDDQLRQRSYLLQQISESRGKLQTQLGVKVEGKTLIEAAEKQLEALGQQKSLYEKTNEIDKLRGRTQQLNEALTYLQDEQKTKDAEENLPTLTKQVEELEARKTSLQHLSGSLESLRRIITEYQKEASIKQINSLEEMMNEYYSSILGHPYFHRLKIDIEKEDPLQFSFRAASDREATYIPTRFSTAQLNVAAISIFISNSRLMAGQLPLLTFDDPTQNMDSEHKEAFAKLVSRLIQDFQVIIATEDTETRDYLLKYSKDPICYNLNAWGPEGLLISST